MATSNAFQADLLKAIFQNVNIANLGDATGLRGSTAAGSVYVSLHTADPTAAGTQGSNEATYTGYARVAVVRSSAGWTVAGSSPTSCSNAAIINFPICTAGSNTCTFFGVGSGSSGATELMDSGALTSSLAVSNGITPSAAIGAVVVTCS
jgi:hypothetical protein